MWKKMSSFFKNSSGYFLNISSLVKWTISPCKARQVQSRCRLICYLTNFFVIMEGGSLAMSAGANPTIFGPIWSSFMHECIIHLVLRFLHMTYPDISRTEALRAAFRAGTSWAWFWLQSRRKLNVSKVFKTFKLFFGQGCQISIGTTYQNGEKYTKCQ
jgi:hypothetical protein